MDFRYLAAFRSVGKHQSLTTAAHELKIAVSAISRQIALFEKNIGQPLFERHSRKLVLTETGKQILKETERFSAATQTILNSKSATRPIRVGCLQSIFEEKLLSFIKSNHKQNPTEIVISSPSSLMEMLRQSRLDVVISCKTQNMTGIDSIKLYEEIPCLASNSDGNTKIVFLPYEELWKEIDPSDGNTMRVNSLNAAIELAKAKIGTTLIPYPMAVKHGFANINPIRHKRVPMYFCTEKFTKTPGQITAFLKRLRDWKN